MSKWQTVDILRKTETYKFSNSTQEEILMIDKQHTPFPFTISQEVFSKLDLSEYNIGVFNKPNYPNMYINPYGFKAPLSEGTLDFRGGNAKNMTLLASSDDWDYVKFKINNRCSYVKSLCITLLLILQSGTTEYDTKIELFHKGISVGEIHFKNNYYIPFGLGISASPFYITDIDVVDEDPIFELKKKDFKTTTAVATYETIYENKDSMSKVPIKCSALLNYSK